jgi:UDP-N-acetylmuramate--alanine ligase
LIVIDTSQSAATAQASLHALRAGSHIHLIGVAGAGMNALAAPATWRAERISQHAEGSRFTITHPCGHYDVVLPFTGLHYVSNALQAIAAASVAGVAPQSAAAALYGFRGTGRRFQRVGESAGVLVIDDYAHHPTEVRATLAAAKARYPARRLIAVFQPHTYSRTRLLFDDFMHAFDGADLLVLCAIYAARETDTLGIDAGQLAKAIAERPGAPAVQLSPELADIPARLAPQLRPGDLVLTLGAGSITELGPRLLAAVDGSGERVSE